jgi:hypothetical protein
MNPPRLVSLKLDVRCKYEKTPAIYRIYVDNDLITERTWYWNRPEAWRTEHVITENIETVLTLGRHKLVFEPIDSHPDNFYLHNFTLNGQILHPYCRGLTTEFAVHANCPAFV